jgi:hypothetical protein
MTEIFNSQHQPIISWKGQALSQITSSIRKNTPSTSGSKSYFLPPPLKIYRRELITQDISCNMRTSSSITVNDMPGSSIVNSQSTTCKGLDNTLDITLTSNTSDIPGSHAAAECVVGTPETNARARVRSSGMIRKKYNVANNTESYYTDTKQFLTSRNATFQQNQYNYIRYGDSTATPGTSLSVQNIYTPNGNGRTLCQKHFFATDTSFQYEWFGDEQVVGEQIIFDVTIPSGYYDILDINSVLHNTMTTNGHYYVRADNNTKEFLLDFKLNNLDNTSQIETTAIKNTYITSESWTQGKKYNPLTGALEAVDWDTPGALDGPKIILHKGRLITDALGFSFSDVSLSYPSTPYVDDQNTETLTFTSNNKTAFSGRYRTLIYKPNNPQFAQQGAVSSSSLITRKKYNAITNSANSYLTPYGLHVANALSYGNPANGYTIKDKQGYPLPKVPVVDSTGNYKECKKTTLRGG